MQCPKNDKYGLYRVGNKHRIVKNLKDFDNSQQAIAALKKLIKGEITEDQLKNS